jgi:hypothetical protein
MSKEVDTVVHISLEEMIDLDMEGFLNQVEREVLNIYNIEDKSNYVLMATSYRLEKNVSIDDSIPIRVTGKLLKIW